MHMRFCLDVVHIPSYLVLTIKTTQTGSLESIYYPFRSVHTCGFDISSAIPI